jgi:hypothetical protein
MRLLNRSPVPPRRHRALVSNQVPAATSHIKMFTCPPIVETAPVPASRPASTNFLLLDNPIIAVRHGYLTFRCPFPRNAICLAESAAQIIRHQ